MNHSRSKGGFPMEWSKGGSGGLAPLRSKGVRGVRRDPPIVIVMKIRHQ